MVGTATSGRRPEGDKKLTTQKPPSNSALYFGKLISHGSTAPPSSSDPAFIAEQMRTEGRQAVQDKIKAYEVVKSLESRGLPQNLIDEFKKEFSLEQPLTATPPPDAFLDPIKMFVLDMIRTEQNPNAKRMLAMSMQGSKVDMNTLAMAMSMSSSNQTPEKKESELEKVLLPILVETIKNNSNKSDLDQLDKFTGLLEKINKIQNPNNENSIEKLFDWKEKLIDLGIVQDPQETSEDKRWKLEEKKVDLEFKRMEQENANKLAHDKEMMGIAAHGANAIATFATSLMQSKNPQQSPPPQPGPTNTVFTNQKTQGVECSNPACVDNKNIRNRFMITLDKPRTFDCPFKCGFSYEIKEESGAMNFYLSPESTTKLEELEKDQQQTG